MLTGCPTDIVSNANQGASTSVVTWLAPVASDNSGTPTLTVTIPPGSTFPVGSTEVTYTATDAAGNFVSCSFNVIVLSTGGKSYTHVQSMITRSFNNKYDPSAQKDQ